MTTAPVPPTTAPLRGLERIGIPKNAIWGLIAVIVFLVGDGIELTWLTTFLSTKEPYTLSEAGFMVTAYGVVVAIASFLSGALADAIGAKRVMMLGFVGFVVFDLLFILVALPAHNYALLLIVYALRGFGYPLFGYGLLTWMMQAAPNGRQSATAGWFWFAFSFGQQILGSFISSLLLPKFGAFPTLWAGLGMVIVGGLGALFLIRVDFQASAGSKGKILHSLGQGISIAWRAPRIGLGGLVKVINLCGILGFTVFYVPFLTEQVHLPLGSAILYFTVAGIVVVIGNLVWGFVGDTFGWRNTVQWIAAPLCVAGVLYSYYVPLAVGPNLGLIVIGAVIFAAGLSAFVPITPLVVGLAPAETGSALSIVNLGSGLAAFVGPAIASTLTPLIGLAGVIWVLAALYAVAFVLMFAIRLPGNARTIALTATDETPAFAAPIH